MYKVVASNNGGQSETPWVIGTTREGLPNGVQAPYSATPFSGYTIGNRLLTIHKVRQHSKCMTTVL